MSTSPATLDPAVEEVLRDIAKDPRAKLFAVDPRKLVLGLRSSQRFDVSAAQAGLTNAERQLVTVHRDEVATLLLAEHVRLLLSAPDSRSLATRPPIDRNDWRARAEVAVRVSSVIEGDSRTQRSGLQWLTAAVAPGPGAQADRKALLFASMRLVDRLQGRHQYVEEVLTEERPHAALTTLIRLGPQVRSPEWYALLTHQTSRALSLLGRPWDALVNSRELLRSHRFTHVSPGLRKIMLASQMVFSREADSQPDILTAARGYAAESAVRDTLHESILGRLSARRHRDEPPRPGSWDRRHFDSVGALAREILDVIL